MVSKYPDANRVIEGLDILGPALRPWVQEHMKAKDGEDWLEKYQAAKRSEHKSQTYRVSDTDPRDLLRILAFELRDIDDDTRFASNQAHSIMSVSNPAHHNSEKVTPAKADAALNAMKAIIALLGLNADTSKLDTLMTTAPAPEPGETPSSGSRPSNKDASTPMPVFLLFLAIDEPRESPRPEEVHLAEWPLGAPLTIGSSIEDAELVIPLASGIEPLHCTLTASRNPEGTGMVHIQNWSTVGMVAGDFRLVGHGEERTINTPTELRLGDPSTVIGLSVGPRADV